MMMLQEMIQTTGAMSGLFCLTFVLLAIKRQLKVYIL
jgi:hypothetical protein